TTTTTAQYIDSAFWSFDSNALELYNSGLDGALAGIPGYTTSVFGYGAAIYLARSSTQYVYITPKVLPFDSRSFTIEAWIYPISLSSGTEYGIFGQCQSSSYDLCLHFVIRSSVLYCGFFSNDVSGVTTLTSNTWYHVACIYDSITQTQQVWLDGNLDNSRSASAYNGLWGITTIGATFVSGSASSFNGYIDNTRYAGRAKNSTEISNDATLQVYYSFDGGALTDNGPNGINGTAYGSLSSTTGRVNGALQFSMGSYISYSYNPFYFLGVDGKPHTIAVWVKPTGSYSTQTIFFVGSISYWCVHFLVMQSNGKLYANSWRGAGVSLAGPILPLNTWTHIGYTYSSTNGVRLYIDGILHSSTGAFTFSSARQSVPIVLGGDAGQTGCSPSYGGAFTGALDEFYLYRRELTVSEIWSLANP
ncbi:unnamed protein product, partial [Rotaria sp. Silwood1]